MNAVKLYGIVVVSSLIFALTCVTVVQFITFLSGVSEKLKGAIENSAPVESNSVFPIAFVRAITNISLICVFILQHSFLIQPLKTFAQKLGVSVLDRSFYNLTTCIALLTLIRCWKVDTSYVLWHVDIENNQILWAVYSLIHTTTWLIIYVGIICMDVTELIGMKQVFYYVKNVSYPENFKSKDLQRFLNHMRHPSLTGFLILLWIFPIMSLDRLLLASMWTVYMLVAWKVDIKDYNYVLRQQYRKKIL